MMEENEKEGIHLKTLPRKGPSSLNVLIHIEHIFKHSALVSRVLPLVNTKDICPMVNLMNPLSKTLIQHIMNKFQP